MAQNEGFVAEEAPTKLQQVDSTRIMSLAPAAPPSRRSRRQFLSTEEILPGKYSNSVVAVMVVVSG